MESEGASLPGRRLCHHSEKHLMAPKGGQRAPLQQSLGSSGVCPGKKALKGTGCAISEKRSRAPKGGQRAPLQH